MFLCKGYSMYNVQTTQSLLVITNLRNAITIVIAFFTAAKEIKKIYKKYCSFSTFIKVQKWILKYDLTLKDKYVNI